MADGDDVQAVAGRVLIAQTNRNLPGLVDVVGDLSGDDASGAIRVTLITAVGVGGVGLTKRDFEAGVDFVPVYTKID